MECELEAGRPASFFMYGLSVIGHLSSARGSGIDDRGAGIGGQRGGMADDRNHLDAGGGDPAGRGKYAAAGESDGKKNGGCEESKANHGVLPGDAGRPCNPEMKWNRQYTAPMPGRNRPDTRRIQFNGRMLLIPYAVPHVPARRRAWPVEIRRNCAAPKPQPSPCPARAGRHRRTHRS